MERKYTKEEIIDLAHKNITRILSNKSEPILLSQLVNELNISLKSKFPSKKKSFSKHLKQIYQGGVYKFLDDYLIYGIITESNNIIKVVLVDSELNELNKSYKRITKDSDWVFI